ncbi:MAG: TonB-dependent receptor [bacterium]
MKTFILLFTTIFLFGAICNAQSDKVYNMNEIIVTSGRAPITFLDLSRTVSVINSDEIKSLPVNNIQDLLKFVNAVDMRARGAEGVQGDVSIRGGNFEQTLILIDGIKMNDAQTGHHNLNLPISLSNVERIEILKGQGSRIFGPNAFSGAINIITKKAKDNSLSAQVLAGGNGLYEVDFSSNLNFGSGISISKKKSDGYRPNTAFDIFNLSFSQNILLGTGSINLFYGYVDKKFGANSFYSDRFPNQWEHTSTKIFNTTAEVDVSGILISPKVYFRINDDDYYLDKNRPDWEHSIHKTDSYGGEIQASFKGNLGTTAFGAEFGNEKIQSTKLGSHGRSKGGIFFEQVCDISDQLIISAGFFVFKYAEIGWKLWPGFESSYKLNSDTKIYASIGKAFRLPSFTELYYVSPANMGNTKLHHEETINYEIGFTYFQNLFQTNISLFLKDGNNLIDWVRFDKNEPWKVENVTNVSTIGSEINLVFSPQYFFEESPVYKIGIQYTYLSADMISGNFDSKYLLDNLKHQLVLETAVLLPLEVNMNWFFRYQQRVNFYSNFINDIRFSKRISDFNFFINISNVFNQSYNDVYGVPLPGRWISAGLKYELVDL